MVRVLFDKMPAKNLVSWTKLISGYAVEGLVKHALSLYEKMEETGLEPDGGTTISILANCAESGFAWEGRRLHASIQMTGYDYRTFCI